MATPSFAALVGTGTHDGGGGAMAPAAVGGAPPAPGGGLASSDLAAKGHRADWGEGVFFTFLLALRRKKVEHTRVLLLATVLDWAQLLPFVLSPATAWHPLLAQSLRRSVGYFTAAGAAANTGSSDVFRAAYWAALSVLLAAVLMSMWTAWAAWRAHLGTGAPQPQWRLRLTRRLIILVGNGGFITLLQLFWTPWKCMYRTIRADGSPLADYTTVGCWSTHNAPLAIVGVFASLMLFALALTERLLAFDPDPRSRQPQAVASPTVHILAIVLRAAIVALPIVAFYVQFWCVFLTAAIFIYWLLQLQQEMPYYSYTGNITHVAVLSGLTALAVVQVGAELLHRPDVVFWDEVLAIAGALACLAGAAWVKNDLDTLNGGSPTIVRRRAGLLADVAVVHKFDAPHHVEVCTRFLRGVVPDKAAVARGLAIFDAGVAQFGDVPSLTMALANYVLAWTPDFLKGAALLERVKRAKPGLLLRYAVFVREQEGLARRARAQGYTTMNLETYVIFERLFKEASRTHRRALSRIRKFWRLVHANNLTDAFRTTLEQHEEEDTDEFAAKKAAGMVGLEGTTSAYLRQATLERYARAAVDIDRLAAESQTSYASLLERYPRSSKLLRALARFHLEVNQQPRAAEKCLAQADSIDEAGADEAHGGERDGAFKASSQVDDSVDALVIIDSRGTILNVNANCRRMFGYSESELISRNVSTLMPPQYAAAHDSFLHSYLTTGVAKVVGHVRRLEGRHRDGYTFPIDLAVNRIDTAQGITFAGIVHAVPEEEGVCTITLDEEGRVLCCNRTFCRTFGWAVAEVLGSNIKKFMPRQHARHHDEYLARFKRSGQSAAVGVSGRRLQGLHKNGMVFPISVEVEVRDVGGRNVYVGRLLELAGSAGVITINEVGIIQSCNKAALTLFGYAAANDLVGRNVNRLMPEPYASFHGQYLERYMATNTGRIVGGTGRYVIGKHNDGSTFPIALKVVEVKVAARSSSSAATGKAGNASGSDGRKQRGGKPSRRGAARADDGPATSYKRLFAAEITLANAPIGVGGGPSASGGDGDGGASPADDPLLGAISITDTGTILFVNGVLCRTFGWSSTALVGQNIKVLMPPEFAAKHDGYLARHKETGENRIVGRLGRQLMGMHKTGYSFPVALTVEEESVGGRITYHGTIRALTDIEGMVIADLEGRILQVNQGICYLFGYRQSELEGRNVTKFMGRDHRKAHAGYMRAYRETGKTRLIGSRQVMPARHSDGSILPVQIEVAVIKHPEYGRCLAARLTAAMVSAEEAARLAAAATARADAEVLLQSSSGDTGDEEDGVDAGAAAAAAVANTAAEAHTSGAGAGAGTGATKPAAADAAATPAKPERNQRGTRAPPTTEQPLSTLGAGAGASTASAAAPTSPAPAPSLRRSRSSNGVSAKPGSTLSLPTDAAAGAGAASMRGGATTTRGGDSEDSVDMAGGRSTGGDDDVLQDDMEVEESGTPNDDGDEGDGEHGEPTNGAAFHATAATNTDDSVDDLAALLMASGGGGSGARASMRHQSSAASTAISTGRSTTRIVPVQSSRATGAGGAAARLAGPTAASEDSPSPDDLRFIFSDKRGLATSFIRAAAALGFSRRPDDWSDPALPITAFSSGSDGPPITDAHMEGKPGGWVGLYALGTGPGLDLTHPRASATRTTRDIRDVGLIPPQPAIPPFDDDEEGVGAAGVMRRSASQGGAAAVAGTTPRRASTESDNSLANRLGIAGVDGKVPTTATRAAAGGAAATPLVPPMTPAQPRRASASSPTLRALSARPPAGEASLPPAAAAGQTGPTQAAATPASATMRDGDSVGGSSAGGGGGEDDRGTTDSGLAQSELDIMYDDGGAGDDSESRGSGSDSGDGRRGRDGDDRSSDGGGSDAGQSTDTMSAMFGKSSVDRRRHKQRLRLLRRMRRSQARTTLTNLRNSTTTVVVTLTIVFTILFAISRALVNVLVSKVPLVPAANQRAELLQHVATATHALALAESAADNASLALAAAVLEHTAAAAGRLSDGLYLGFDGPMDLSAAQRQHYDLQPVPVDVYVDTAAPAVFTITTLSFWELINRYLASATLLLDAGGPWRPGAALVSNLQINALSAYRFIVDNEATVVAHALAAGDLELRMVQDTFRALSAFQIAAFVIELAVPIFMLLCVLQPSHDRLVADRTGMFGIFTTVPRGITQTLSNMTMKVGAAGDRRGGSAGGGAASDEENSSGEDDDDSETEAAMQGQQQAMKRWLEASRKKTRKGRLRTPADALAAAAAAEAAVAAQSRGPPVPFLAVLASPESRYNMHGGVAASPLSPDSAPLAETPAWRRGSADRRVPLSMYGVASAVVAAQPGSSLLRSRAGSSAAEPEAQSSSASSSARSAVGFAEQPLLRPTMAVTEPRRGSAATAAIRRSSQLTDLGPLPAVRRGSGAAAVLAGDGPLDSAAASGAGAAAGAAAGTATAVLASPRSQLLAAAYRPPPSPVARPLPVHGLSVHDPIAARAGRRLSSEKPSCAATCALRAQRCRRGTMWTYRRIAAIRVLAGMPVAMALSFVGLLALVTLNFALARDRLATAESTFVVTHLADKTSVMSGRVRFLTQHISSSQYLVDWVNASTAAWYPPLASRALSNLEEARFQLRATVSHAQRLHEAVTFTVDRGVLNLAGAGEGRQDDEQMAALNITSRLLRVPTRALSSLEEAPLLAAALGLGSDTLATLPIWAMADLSSIAGLQHEVQAYVREAIVPPACLRQGGSVVGMKAAALMAHAVVAAGTPLSASPPLLLERERAVAAAERSNGTRRAPGRYPLLFPLADPTACVASDCPWHPYANLGIDATLRSLLAAGWRVSNASAADLGPFNPDVQLISELALLDLPDGSVSSRALHSEAAKAALRSIHLIESLLYLAYLGVLSAWYFLGLRPYLRSLTLESYRVMTILSFLPRKVDLSKLLRVHRRRVAKMLMERDAEDAASTG